MAGGRAGRPGMDGDPRKESTAPTSGLRPDCTHCDHYVCNVGPQVTTWCCQCGVICGRELRADERCPNGAPIPVQVAA